MKINPGKLDKYVEVIEVVIDNSGTYTEEREEVVFGAWAKIDEMYLKDYQLSMANGTLDELKLLMRYDDRIGNKMRIKREDGRVYKVKNILFDESDQVYMHVFVERVDG